MKLINYLKDIFQEVIRILLYPQNHWLRVRAEKDFITGGFRRFFVPGLVLVVVAVFFGDLLFESEYGFLFKDTLIKATRKVLILILTLFASNMIIYEVSRLFKVPMEFESARKIATYSMLPVVLMTMLIGLFPFLDILGIMSLYSLYLLYNAVHVLCEVKLQKNLSYVSLLLGSVFLAYVFIAYLLSILTALIIY